PPLSETTISGLPSPSRSPVALSHGTLFKAKSALAVKEKLSGEQVFLKTDIELLPALVTTRSGLPSPSISLTATRHDPEFNVVGTLMVPGNEMVPGILLL